MARRVVRGTRNADPPAARRKRGGLFTGLFFGLIAGLVIAAALAWYFNRESGVFKAPEERIETVQPPPIAAAPPAPAAKPRSEPAPSVKPPPVKTTPPPPRAAAPKPPTPAPPRPAPRVDYTFYGILPGEQPGKPATPPEKPPAPPRADDHWWLQVAALSNADDADKLKARLTLLGLRVTTQQVASGGLTLHRVRVGPYPREEDSFGDLDILAANDFEPRLLKDPSKP